MSFCDYFAVNDEDWDWLFTLCMTDEQWIVELLHQYGDTIYGID